MAGIGVGALGGVVLVDPDTGLPYRAEGGGGGGSDSWEVRHDTVGGYDYTGVAVKGASEGASSWEVTRITLVSPPVVESATGAWSDRVNLVYS